MLTNDTLAHIEHLLGDRPTPWAPETGKQPVHVVYGGAHLFKADAAAKLGDLALRSLRLYAPDAVAFGLEMGISEPDLAREVHRRVEQKLQREPVEALHIDFEDGYGLRPDDEEDGHARGAAREVARGMAEGLLPPQLGVRIKALGRGTRARALRTLDVFFSALVAGAGGALPPGFSVVLPKASHPAEVAALAAALEAIEQAAGYAPASLRVELMIETPEAILTADGRLGPRRLVEAAAGRCDAVHFGTYDYTAACGVTAVHQKPDHPACDLARHLTQLALAGSGVRISDGATTTLPIPPHRGAELSEEQRRDNQATVLRAWRLHHASVTRALIGGFYQGWDLHPAQLPARYAAVFAFFLSGADETGRRLRNFVERAAQATHLGGVFDDAATGHGLVNFFLRARACGALTDDEIAAHCGGRGPDELARIARQWRG